MQPPDTEQPPAPRQQTQAPALLARTAGGLSHHNTMALGLSGLAFFEHHLSISPKKLMGPGELDPHFNVRSSRLQDCVAELMRRKSEYVRATGLQFAVADLSCDPNHPDLAGSKMYEYWEAASTAKIALAYAAFQLQRDLNAMAAQNSAKIKTEADLFQFAQSQWRAALTRETTNTGIATPAGQPILTLADRLLLKTTPGGKQVPLLVSQSALPNPAMIFVAKPNATGVLEVSFKLPNGHQLWERPPRAADREFCDVRNLEFIEQLGVTLDGSNNEGATAVIKALGFIYIASVMMQSNLYDLSHANGLWVGRFYPHGNVVAPPVPDPLAQTPDHEEIFAAQSARSGVTFMTLLEQNRLVDSAACDQIREMLDHSMQYGGTPQGNKKEAGLRSPVGDALQARGKPVDEIFSKIGLGGRNNVWDIAFVKRTTPSGKRLSYAIAILDSVSMPDDPVDGPLFNIAFDLDQCVERANS